MNSILLRPAALVTLALALSLLSGCARYKMTFNNLTTTTTHGKPKYDKENGTYVFKDAKGNKQTVPAFTVQSVEPY